MSEVNYEGNLKEELDALNLMQMDYIKSTCVSCVSLFVSKF